MMLVTRDKDGWHVVEMTMAAPAVGSVTQAVGALFQIVSPFPFGCEDDAKRWIEQQMRLDT